MNLQGVEMLNLDNQFCYTSKQKKHLIKKNQKNIRMKAKHGVIPT